MVQKIPARQAKNLMKFASFCPPRPVAGHGGHTTPPGGEPFAYDVKIHQRKAAEHPVGVLLQPAIANPVESKLPLHHT
jgi:hypothetical protein